MCRKDWHVYHSGGFKCHQVPRKQTGYIKLVVYWFVQLVIAFAVAIVFLTAADILLLVFNW